MDQRGSAAGPPKARTLTVLALIVLILGASTPLRLALEWKDIWVLMQSELEQHGFSYLLEALFRVGLGALGAVSGWGVLKRRSWAPLAACIAAGAILVDSGYWLYGLGVPTITLIATNLTLKYLRVIVTMGLPMLIHAVVFAAWLLIVIRVLRVKGREEFKAARPEITPATLWTSLGISALLCALFLALQIALYRGTPARW